MRPTSVLVGRAFNSAYSSASPLASCSPGSSVRDPDCRAAGVSEYESDSIDAAGEAGCLIAESSLLPHAAPPSWKRGRQAGSA